MLSYIINNEVISYEDFELEYVLTRMGEKNSIIYVMPEECTLIKNIKNLRL